MTASLLPVLLPALVPAISDAMRGIIGKLTGGTKVQPQSVAEYIQITQADTDRIKAMAELDKPVGEISRWVADLRASFRYIAAGFILLIAALSIFIPGIPVAYVEMVWTGAESSWSFIFGDRMYSYIRRK